MIKMIIPAAGFAAMMLMNSIPGYCGTPVGCEQNLDCRAGVTKAAPSGRVDMVNQAAANLLRQIVDNSTLRGPRVTR
jgi:hypothetical protein